MQAKDIIQETMNREIPASALRLAKARERGGAHYVFSRTWKLLMPLSIAFLLLLGPYFYNLAPSAIQGADPSVIFDKNSSKRDVIFGPDYVIFTEELMGAFEDIVAVTMNLTISGKTVYNPVRMERNANNVLTGLFVPDINPLNRWLSPGEYRLQATVSNIRNQSDTDSISVVLGEYPGHNGTLFPTGKYFALPHSGKTVLAAPIYDLAEGNLSIAEVHPELGKYLETAASDYFEIKVAGNTYVRELEDPQSVGSNQFSNIELASPMFLYKTASFVSFSNSWSDDYQILDITREEFSASVGMESIIENTSVIGPALLDFGLLWLSQYGEIVGVPKNITQTQFFCNLSVGTNHTIPAHLYFYNQFFTGFPVMGIDIVGTRGNESDLEIINEIAPDFKLRIVSKESDWDFRKLYEGATLASFTTAIGNTTKRDISDDVLYYLHVLRRESYADDLQLYQTYSFDFEWYLLQNGLNMNYLNIKGIVLVIREYMADRGVSDPQDTAAYRARVGRAIFNNALKTHEVYKDAAAWVGDFSGDDDRLFMFYPHNSSFEEGGGKSGLFLCIADPSAYLDEDIDAVTSPPKDTIYGRYKNTLPVVLTGSVKELVRAEYEMNLYLEEG